MVEEHIGVFEKPREEQKVQGDAEEAGVACDPEQEGEDQDQRGCAASGWAD
jgi:hypothetical protein